MYDGNSDLFEALLALIKFLLQMYTLIFAWQGHLLDMKQLHESCNNSDIFLGGHKNYLSTFFAFLEIFQN